MSPRTQKQVQMAREEKKALIMSVALGHFANQGYFKTSIDNIARHAGISKGLMYNYFESKEDLLITIINSSIEEISRNFNPENKGVISEEEFEQFVRKLFQLLRGQIEFWRLLSQILIQKDVRDQFLNTTQGRINSTQIMYTNRHNTLLILLSQMITNYFLNKKNSKPAGYDPVLDMNLFIYTIEGFARITIYQDDVDEDNYSKAIDKIIELYK
jgi:AcrR family transcriptional regulator